MGNVIAKDPDFWSSTEDPHGTYHDWMKALPSATSIASLSIPGTHNSFTYKPDVPTPWIYCQSLSFEAQWRMGIRYFDLRLHHSNDELTLYHGNKGILSKLGFNFEEVLLEVKGKLLENPSEMAFLRVKKEWGLDHHLNNTFDYHQRFEAALMNVEGCVWKGESVPTVEEVRGKIVFLNGDGPEDVLFKVMERDEWELDGSVGMEVVSVNKVEILKKHFEEKQSGDMLVSFTNFSVGAMIPSQTARSLNPKLHDYIANEAKICLGIVVMDYPGPQIVSDIIKLNHFN